jgi:3-oxoacyl-[acyl-carrier protein] reductase
LDFGLKGRVALVMGADLAVGRACAMELAREGARLVLAGPNVDRLREAAASVEAVGAHCTVTLNSHDPDGAAAAARAALAAYGSVDVVIAVVPPTRTGFLENFEDDAAFDEGWNIVAGFAALYQGVLAGMKERRWGRLICVGPVEAKGITERAADLDRVVGLGALGLQKNLAGELGRFGITAASVLWDGGSAPSEASVTAASATAVFLASGAASYLTGIVITADGANGRGVF